MNIQEKDILISLTEKEIINQRELSRYTNHSLGTINFSVKKLKQENYIDNNFKLSEKAINMLRANKVKKAIILAAGFGLRMVPINMSFPKALLEVRNEILIERLIKQLKERDIDDIYIVVGYKRENFDYLVDKYQVQLIINNKYAKKNNLYSFFLVKDFLEDCYILPCDLYFENNPFNKYELYSWYMLTNEKDENSKIKANKKRQLVKTRLNEFGNRAIGVSYIRKETANYLKERLEILIKDIRYNNSFWEEVLFDKNKIEIYGKIVESNNVIEVNTYKDLYSADKNSKHLKSKPIEIIQNTLNVSFDKIGEIKALKKGMTNRSFLFSVDNKKYIMRIPGEGTEQLINRREEASVYKVINGKKICDEVLYINENNGYKITEFIENGHSCNMYDEEELQECMNFLRKFHNYDLKVEHEFNIFDKIDFYESLWKGTPSGYSDYEKIKQNIFSLKNYINRNVEKKSLTHIDAVADNFLIIEKEGKKEIKLLDWEYAGMQDPHVDIAMFSIYALYDKEQIDKLIDIYFENNCKKNIRIKIYAYIATCGLLWSNWCEYKRNLGIEFGEYSLKQYRYAKDYYKIVVEELKKIGESL